MGDVYHNFVTNLNLMHHLTRKFVGVVYAEGIFKRLFSHSVHIKLARAQAAQPGIHFFRKISRSACGSSFKDALLRRKKKKPSRDLNP